MEFVLVVFLSWGGNCPMTYETYFKTRTECLKEIEKVNIVIPNHNAENEYAGIKMCMSAKELKEKRELSSKKAGCSFN